MSEAMERQIDVCIVAARRPDLLRQTLESFCARLIAHFPVASVIANIDPVFGSEREHQEAVEVVRNFFPDARIHSPETPGFCAAVQRVWSSTKSDFVLHLEDDWLLNEDVYPAILASFEDGETRQVAFSSRERGWDIARKGVFHYRRRQRALFGKRLPLRYKFPAFTTSPSFLQGDFARRVAELYDANFDPEKQFYSNVNKPLEAFVSDFRCLIYQGPEAYTVTDIGRSWRDAEGIAKTVKGAVTTWTPAKSA